MRVLATIVVVVIAAWFGSVLASCGGYECAPCRGGRPISGGKFTITKSSLPALVGGEVDADVKRFVIRYRVDGAVREIVFRGTRS